MSSLVRFAPYIKDQLLRLIFPWSCAACGKELAGTKDAGFCPDCELNLPRIQGLVCIRCGVSLPEGGMRCYRCRTNPAASPLRIRSAVQYTKGIPSAIYRFKYFGRESLATVFANLMVSAYANYFLEPIDYLIPVPLHFRHQRQRGFNQAELLAQALSAHLQIPVLSNVLNRARLTKPQYGLNRAARQINVEDAFTLKTSPPFLEKKSVLLIDDICTTGSTFAACARALKLARIARIQGYAFARDE